MPARGSRHGCCVNPCGLPRAFRNLVDGRAAYGSSLRSRGADRAIRRSCRREVHWRHARRDANVCTPGQNAGGTWCDDLCKSTTVGASPHLFPFHTPPGLIRASVPARHLAVPPCAPACARVALYWSVERYGAKQTKLLTGCRHIGRCRHRTADVRATSIHARATSGSRPPSRAAATSGPASTTWTTRARRGAGCDA